MIESLWTFIGVTLGLWAITYGIARYEGEKYYTKVMLPVIIICAALLAVAEYFL